jgi:Tfp pilus assembly protein PilX
MRLARPEPRRGFVLPLALFMLLVIALLAAALLEGAVQELRTARGDLAGARAAAAAGSALTDLIASRPDSALLALPRGSISTSVAIAGAETTAVTLQAMGAGTVRATTVARVWAGGARADASALGFVRIIPDSAGPPGSLRYRHLPGWWWAQLP